MNCHIILDQVDKKKKLTFVLPYIKVVAKTALKNKVRRVVVIVISVFVSPNSREVVNSRFTVSRNQLQRNKNLT